MVIKAQISFDLFGQALELGTIRAFLIIASAIQTQALKMDSILIQISNANAVIINAWLGYMQFGPTKIILCGYDSPKLNLAHKVSFPGRP